MAAGQAVTKAAWVATARARLGDDLARAYRLARSGRPGPVHVSLPADLRARPCPTAPAFPDRGRLRAPSPRRRRRRGAGPDARSISWPRRGGRSCWPARPWRAAGLAAVSRLAERRGARRWPMESPRAPDDPSLGGVRTIFDQADLVVLLGQSG